MRTSRWELADFSGGMQSTTTSFMRDSSELEYVENTDFAHFLGAASGRKGYISFGTAMPNGKKPLGWHVANFPGSTVIMAAVNSSDDTNTEVYYYDDATDSWNILISDLPADCDVHFFNYMDEVYVSGIAGSNRIDPRNIDESLNVSQTRNLIDCPKCVYFAEYRGFLYACNVELNGTVYADRAYRSSSPTEALTFVRTTIDDGSGGATTVSEMSVNSARYVKVGMSIDVYERGTSNRIVTNLEITGIDKEEDKLQFASTSMQVDASDEVWLHNKNPDLGTYWNTDYPTNEESDFLRVPPGTDSSNAITGVKKNGNRLFLFTKNSFVKHDGSNLNEAGNAVGCVSHRTIKSLDNDWMLWLSRDGRVIARNESEGAQEMVSKGIERELSDKSLSKLENATAGTIGSFYKLYLGDDNGRIDRFVYDFDANTWSKETHTRHMRAQFKYEYDSQIRHHFMDDSGQMFVDQYGTNDNGADIPVYMRTGEMDFGDEYKKNLHGVYIFSRNAAGANVSVSTGGEFHPIGQIDGRVTRIGFSKNEQYLSELFDLLISLSTSGDQPVIERIVFYFNIAERVFNDGQ